MTSFAPEKWIVGKPSFEYGPVKQYCDEMTVEGKLIQPEAVTGGRGAKGLAP